MWIGSSSGEHPLTGPQPCHKEPRKCSAPFPLQAVKRVRRLAQPELKLDQARAKVIIVRMSRRPCIPKKDEKPARNGQSLVPKFDLWSCRSPSTWKDPHPSPNLVIARCPVGTRNETNGMREVAKGARANQVP
jgi:hypothetical protein